MATSSLDSVFALSTTLMIVTPAATAAIFMTPTAGQLGWQMTYQSGGTLWIVGAPAGSTLALGTSLAGTALVGATMHYMVKTTEVLSLNGPCSFYLAALGATTMVNVMRQYSAGF